MLTIDTARMAIMGAQIMTNGELLASYEGRIPDRSISALKVVQENPSEFKKLVLAILDTMPLFSQYFGTLVKIRLRQQGYLASLLIGAIFDEYKPVEKRLRNIVESGMVGLESLRKEYRHVAQSPTNGEQTDKVARDLLSEILVLDFLVRLGFTDIERPFSQSQPHVDILAMKDGQVYAIEVTRKQEINNWKTIEFGNLEDCSHKDNLGKIRSVLWNTLWKKNDQFRRALVAGMINPSFTKVVSIKTSDYGFAECSNQAKEILGNLISNTKLAHIDCVWLIPNVEPNKSKWLCR